MSTVFNLAFLAVVPFWALMIFAPTWSWTTRIVTSPLILIPGLVVWAVAAIPVFGDMWTGVTMPSLAFWSDFLRDDHAVAAIWAQVLAWDLFIGRWIFLDSRARGIHPLIMAPLLVFTILLSPIGLPLYLVVRLGFRARTERARVGSAV
ncbi:ABA4-like family protein [Actinokineospora enzanensis]|uniref:ABA4-like family protein n=1 Tax=Actinokineospora enzanensis TaxID=155975 RepID=UPI000366C200|nr:ABA4-like family protein [Actinokineospora enzanensis]